MTLVDNVVAPVASLPTVPASLARVHRDLRRQPHLRPSAEVNALFRELVGLVVGVPPGGRAPVAPRRTAELRRLCAEGEYQLEWDWARRVVDDDDPAEALALFPYLGNYRRLVRLEVDALGRTAGRRVRRVAFLGAGPLPLSPLLLAEALGAPVDAVDCVPAAVDAGRRVTAALGHGHGHAAAVTVAEGDAGRLDVSGYDVIVLAALVGATRAAKRSVLAHLAATMAPGAVLVARSARAARTLLYPPVDARDLHGFDLQAVIHPVDDIVNSVVVARVPHADGGC